MAPQLSLPSIGRSALRPGRVGRQSRSGTRGDPLGGNRIEQFGIIEPVARLGLVDRLFGQLPVAFRVEHLGATRGACRPVLELRLRYDANVEQHVREAVAAEMRRQALIAS